ncbi:proline-rich receptor-like protein kinase PERK2 [Cyprinus carpio]|uniref:Proline-rich receptor-like protein kinase PERK2 n=1 Tax=Cyprinus carpio TaxID=7962 RepID=A0A9Q9XFJ7_CYPCA|nr:proline-rich receptor-like protein kinase PERK2 [Cyprinus carpio]XP_042600899.1 proline-rich receptor-like protein kinase PERK2 [Cyprinus carpio]
MAGRSLVSASESQTPPRPFDPAAPPWLLAPSSPPWPISLPALSWSIVNHMWPRDSTPLATPLPSVPLALSDSFPPATPWSSVALALPRPSGSLPFPQLPEPSALPWPSGSYPSPWLSVSTSGSDTVGRPPGVVSLSSTMAPPSVGSTVGRHHGCDLGPAWLLWLPSVFSLAPPSIGSTLVPSVFSLAPPSIGSTLVPSVSSLAHPSIWSALDSVGRPPPSYPATS